MGGKNLDMIWRLLFVKIPTDFHTGLHEFIYLVE